MLRQINEKTTLKEDVEWFFWILVERQGENKLRDERSSQVAFDNFFVSLRKNKHSPEHPRPLTLCVD